MKDVTAVIINWLTARRTLGAIQSFRKFYPKMKLLIVDDSSNEKDKTFFLKTYNSPQYRTEIIFDPDNDKLKGLPNSTFIQAPDFNVPSHSHGHCMEYLKDKVDTTWMFMFHSDFRFLKPGYIEFLMKGVDEAYAGAGYGKTRHSKCFGFGNVATVYNIKAIKEHNLTLKTVIYYDDGTISEYPGAVVKGKKGPQPLEAGMYAIGALHNMGYKMRDVGYDNYGVHLRFYGDEKRWKKLY